MNRIAFTLIVLLFSTVGVAAGQRGQPFPSEVGTWAFHSHKGSFALHLLEGGACYVLATVEPEGGAIHVPCQWEVSRGLVVVSRAGYRVVPNSDARTRDPLPNAPIHLRYERDQDALQLLGGPETWLQRVK